MAVAIACAAAAAAPFQTVAAAHQPAGTQKPTLDITLTSTPNPPKTGENTFEVVVKDASGKPVTDAEVSAEFFMARMGNMPEMKHTVAFTHQKDGRYVGTGHVMMAGTWDVTVSVKRSGKNIGSKKVTVTAR